MESPPYPLTSDTSLTVYRRMYALRQWVKNERQLLSKLVEPADLQKLDETPTLPDEAQCLAMPIVYSMAAAKAMQDLRLYWDFVVRDCENDWDGNHALSKRLSLLQWAIDLLGDAYNDTETLEAREEDRLKRRSAHKDASEG